MRHERRRQTVPRPRCSNWEIKRRRMSLTHASHTMIGRKQHVTDDIGQKSSEQ